MVSDNKALSNNKKALMLYQVLYKNQYTVTSCCCVCHFFLNS